MKKICLFFAALFLTFFCWGVEIQLDSRQSFPLPASVNPYTLGGNKKHSTLNTLPEFYPVGWSKDNKFAWCQSYWLDGAVINQFDFYIQDLVEDSIVFEMHQSSEEDIVSIWNQLCNKYSDELEKHGIVVSKNKFLKFPVKVKGKKVLVRKIVDELGQDLETGFNRISYKIVAEKEDRVKIINSAKNVLQQDVFVTGCFYSPFENRVAVVLANEVPGFEGTDIKYSISGCQLIIGFE